MQSKKIIIAAITGFSAVAFGAFGAHALKDLLSADLLETYKTGVLYHLVHSAVLLFLAQFQNYFTKSFWFVFTGIILFSFSLYIYSITGFKPAAMITPIGGVCLLIGWLFIVVEAMKMK